MDADRSAPDMAAITALSSVLLTRAAVVFSTDASAAIATVND
jgi:hypothetical protein